MLRWSHEWEGGGRGTTSISGRGRGLDDEGAKAAVLVAT